MSYLDMHERTEHPHVPPQLLTLAYKPVRKSDKEGSMATALSLLFGTPCFNLFQIFVLHQQRPVVQVSPSLELFTQRFWNVPWFLAHGS